MLALSQVGNQYVALLPMVLLGIAWASMMGVPYILVASMVPKGRLGVYMGIVNMMIVVPMLIQTVTFGWIFENVLGGDGTNAIVFAGVLFGIGAVAMLFVSPPRETEESEIMPLGAPRRIDNVYKRVVVGPDGTPNSLKTVGHAAVSPRPPTRTCSSSRPTTRRLLPSNHHRRPRPASIRSCTGRRPQGRLSGSRLRSSRRSALATSTTGSSPAPRLRPSSRSRARTPRT
jgi:MFS family permease